MGDLAMKNCVPCKGGVPPLNPEQSAELLVRLGGGWDVVDNHHLTKTFTFPDFAKALGLVNRAGAIADAQGHHPDIYLAWGKARFDIWTHKIDGLTESDFILAAKIEAVAG